MKYMHACHPRCMQNGETNVGASHSQARSFIFELACNLSTSHIYEDVTCLSRLSQFASPACMFRIEPEYP